MATIKLNSDGTLFEVSQLPELVGDMWECGDRRFYDPDGTLYSIGPTVAPPPPPRHITVLAFRNRFTTTEKVSIEMAALDDPTATMTARQQAAGLRANMKDLDSARYVDLDRTDTRNNVQQMEASGLIGAGRASQILDNVIEDSERYYGE